MLVIEFFSNLFSLSPYTSSRRVFAFGFPVGFQSPTGKEFGGACVLIEIVSEMIEIVVIMESLSRNVIWA